MNDVYIIVTAQAPVTSAKDFGIGAVGGQVIRAALGDAGLPPD